MAAARVSRHEHDRLVRLAGAFALALLTSACAGGIDPGLSVVSQDRFDFMACPEIISGRNNWAGREKQLTELVEKAESSPGGIIVSVTAYRSELAQARTHRRLAEKAAQDKGCETKKP
jgi:hypothetical protein